MNTSLNQPTNNSNPSPAMNPFARALQEARGGQSSDDGISKLGGGNALYESGAPDEMNPQKMIEEQQLQAEKMKRERLRQQLHREINPVEAHDVFKASENRVKAEIENIRYELRMLVQEIASFEKEVDLTLSTNIASPGQDGSYFITFFQQLRAFIMLLRQKVSNAQTWATTFTGKKSKTSAPGMQINGMGHQATKTVFDQMHHERSTAYAGN